MRMSGWLRPGRREGRTLSVGCVGDIFEVKKEREIATVLFRSSRLCYSGAHRRG